MNREEMTNYVSGLESSREYDRLVAERLQSGRRLAFIPPVAPQARMAVAAEELAFEFSFLSLNGPDLWILLKFADFKGVSKADARDRIQIGFKNSTFLVSERTLKPLGEMTLSRIVSAEIPPLQPTLYGDVPTYDYMMALEHVLRVLLALTVLAFLQNVFLKGRSLQSVFALCNSMTLIAHTALFSIGSTPGNVTLAQQLMMRYYSFKYDFFEIRGAFSEKPPYS